MITVPTRRRFIEIMPFSGVALLAEGPCPLFPDKHVTAVGWCNSWLKKA